MKRWKRKKNYKGNFSNTYKSKLLSLATLSKDYIIYRAKQIIIRHVSFLSFCIQIPSVGFTIDDIIFSDQ